MIDKLTSQKRISDLVTRFEDQYDSYKNVNYNETQTRRDFIDPFFKALGFPTKGYGELNWPEFLPRDFWDPTIEIKINW